ncbi:DUF6629 family protein [Streptomyces sp. NPDC058812]
MRASSGGPAPRRLESVSTWCAFAAVCSVDLFGWVNARRAR